MNPALRFERSSKEYIVLSLSLFTVVALIPFTAHRFITQDWLIGGLDLFLVSVCVAVFLYTYKTRKTDIPSLFLALLFVTGEIATVAIKGSSQILWAFPCTVGIYYLTTILRASVINLIAVLMLYVLVRDDLEGIERASFALSLVATNIFTVVFAARNRIQKRQLEELTLKDPLTGVHNRRAFELYLDELDEVTRSEKPHALIMLDVDHFKNLNDRHGHLTGDDVLVRLVALLQTQLHSDEKVYRVGGEEYIIAPINLSLENTYEFADRLRKIVENSKLNEQLGVTISVGVATLELNEPSRTWVARADQALYEAKNKGRNQTCYSAGSDE